METEKTNENIKTKKEGSFIRWQDITIRQMGYTINLILGLAAATLGFAITLLKEDIFFLSCWGKCFFDIACLSFLFSIGFGIWLVLNRLKDFRVTMRIARRREGGDTEENLQPLRDITKRVGKRTWILLYCQVGSFGLGIILLILSIFIIFKDKII